MSFPSARQALGSLGAFSFKKLKMKIQNTYAQKLKHPNWQKKRLQILTRDNFACQSCQDKDSTLHVHHKTYIYGNEPWDYHENNFITLCETCHEEEGFYKQEFNGLIHDGLLCGLSYKEMWHFMHDMVRDKVLSNSNNNHLK